MLMLISFLRLTCPWESCRSDLVTAKINIANHGVLTTVSRIVGILSRNQHAKLSNPSGFHTLTATGMVPHVPGGPCEKRPPHGTGEPHEGPVT